jgi:hypothetical protein
MLDEDDVAEPGGDPKKNRSLRRLPGGRLNIATGGKLFGALELGELETIARQQFGSAHPPQALRGHLAPSAIRYIQHFVV